MSYGSFDYEISDYRKGDLVKVSILVNGEIVEGLSFITHVKKATARGRVICNDQDIFQNNFLKLRYKLIGSKIARETLNKEDVIAKCYGGDVTRKRKTWIKKSWKEKMKQVGSNIPQEAFSSNKIR